MKQKIDSLGRILIPKPLRDELELEIGCTLELIPDSENGSLVIKKKTATCLICGSEELLIPLKKETYLCRNCLDQLK